MAKKERILIAEDDKIVVALLSEFLRSNGFEVVVAVDAMQAMMGVRMNPRAILLDLSMPGGSGFDIIRKVKGNRRTAGIPIVVVTASSDQKTADEAHALGADEFLAKPVDLGQLHVALMRALGRPVEKPSST